MKTVDTKIICDTCDKDISPHLTYYPAEYILHVQSLNIAIPHPSREVYAVFRYPPINNDLYFCNLKCMTNYNRK